MNRPSHWILAMLAVMGPLLWIWGLSDPYVSKADAPLAARRPPPARSPSVVRLNAEPLAAIQSEALLSGEVVDSSGMPVSGARIRVLGGRAAALSGEDGAFEVPVIQGNTVKRLEVTAPGHAPAMAKIAPDGLDAYVIVLQRAVPWAEPPAAAAPARPPLAAEGFVYDKGRIPVPGAVVAIRETGDAVRADQKGMFRLPLEAGSTTLIARDEEGRAAAAATFKPTQREGLVPVLEGLALTRANRVSGRVRGADGGAAAGAGVVLRDGAIVRRARADDTGGFEFTAVLDGEYELELLPWRGGLGITAKLAVTGKDFARDFELAAEVPLRVQVVRADQPVGGAYVSAADGAGRTAVGEADAEGWTTLRGLAHDARVAGVRAPQTYRELALLSFDAAARRVTVGD
jgi:hypothetical protein